MEIEAEQLKTLARRDNAAAVVQIIEIFYERIYAFLRRLSNNDADAADLTQRTFARLPQALPSFAGRSSVASWIHRIAYFIYVDWRRANHRTEPRSEEWWASCRSPEPQPDELAAQADQGRRLYALVDRLEPELRDSVHLHYYQGLTLQETADAMEVAASTVKYRLRQARDELQRAFPAGSTETKPSQNLKTA